jgi:hypothetical protein
LGIQWAGWLFHLVQGMLAGPQVALGVGPWPYDRAQGIQAHRGELLSGVGMPVLRLMGQGNEQANGRSVGCGRPAGCIDHPEKWPFVSP